jgi:hypothetical protein
LGAFAKSGIRPLSPHASGGNALRMLSVDCEFLKKPLGGFDGEKLRETLERFADYLKEKAGKLLPEVLEEEALRNKETQTVVDSAIRLLMDLKDISTPLSPSGTVFIRRLTEAEADAEGAFELIRKSLQGPKLILV